MFTLNQKVFATKQNGKSLTNYFGKELDHRDTVVISRAYIAETKGDSEHGAVQASALIIDTCNNGKTLNVLASASNNTWITLTDGNAAPVIGEGTITLTDNPSLDIILVVPSLNYNLLSVA